MAALSGHRGKNDGIKEVVNMWEIWHVVRGLREELIVAQ